MEKMEMRDFFISYTHSDEAEAVWIARTLTEHGYSVYIQAWHSPSGDSFVSWIEEAIEHSGNFIAVWSKAYSESGQCKGELETEYNRKTEEKIKSFLPVRVEDYPVSTLYGRFGRVDIFNTEKAEAARILLNAVGYNGELPENDSTPDFQPNETEDIDDLLRRLLARAKRNGFFLGFLSCVALLCVCIFSTMIYFYQMGNQCFENGDYARAFEYYDSIPAKSIFNTVPNQMGYMYEKGMGVDINYKQAKRYYEISADAGNAVAMCNLGNLYLHGVGVLKNYETARRYYEQAAEKGNGMALNNLGWLYENGLGVGVDYVKALDYYEKAIENGSVTASENRNRLLQRIH